MIETYKKDAKLLLAQTNIFIVKNLARLVGVRPIKITKADLIDAIIEVLSNDAAPANINRPVKMGDGLYERCEALLEQLLSVLNINDSIIIKTIKARQSLKSKKPEIIIGFTFEEHVDGILSLCKGDAELEHIVGYLDQRWQTKNGSFISLGN